jgi:hypothetical protein
MLHKRTGHPSVIVLKKTGNASQPNLQHDQGSFDPINLSGPGEVGNTLQKAFYDPGDNQVLLPFLNE